jgi:IS30 family transposase
LERSAATISRELRRNRGGHGYGAAQAQALAEQRRRERPLVKKMEDPVIQRTVREKLSQEWSPEQIAGRMAAELPQAPEQCVSAKTIYAWIRQHEDRDYWQGFLRRRGRRPRRPRKPAHPDQARIASRPEVIEQRLRIGDFEGDTVLGPPGTGGIVTLVDRHSRFTLITKVQSKDADHVHQRIKERIRELGEDQRHSITFDNGTEFAHCCRLEKHLGLDLYFADPGCPYQRGTNENTNGLVRQYFPKGTDFRTISHHEARRVEKLLNNRARACLGFRTPAEVFHGEKAPPGCN